jgi:hypothetical protein
MTEEVVKIFYSYSREDLAMRNTLDDHLSALKNAKKIQTWHDLQLEAGTEWERDIQNQLNTADIILLLVSRSFMASKYCYSKELQVAIDRHNAGAARVIPVILRPCDWNHDDVPFSKLNVLPTHAQPITSWSDREEAYAIVAQKIRETVEHLREKKLAAQEESERQRQLTLKQQQPDVLELASEKGINYGRLRDLLAAGKWQEADGETYICMCEAMNNKVTHIYSFLDIEKFPCTDLRTIDMLWVKYSKGKFGFSVQRKIFEKCQYDGGTFFLTVELEFWNKVGWGKSSRLGLTWQEIEYNELEFSLEFSPKEELPYLARVFPSDRGVMGYFFSLTKTCGI